MRFSFVLLLAGCIPGNIWVIEGEPDSSVNGGSDASVSKPDARADSGMTLPGQDAGFDDAGETPAEDTGVSDSSMPPPPPPPPPPPSGSGYDHATEAASDLVEAFDITGRYGIAVTGGHLIAANAQ